MGVIEITITGYRCERCGHEWVPRRSRNLPPSKATKKGVAPPPRQCPRCKSAWWDTPRADT
jgi:predicted Zn-ribbon and HTH transcriptional regulator